MYHIKFWVFFIGFSRASKVVLSLKPAHIVNTNFGWKIPTEQTRILNDVSWGLRLALLKDYSSRPKQNKKYNGARQVDVQALVLSAVRRETEDKTAEEAENDETNMKMKLFRLMYETVKDSDLKVKRLGLIKKHYGNSSAFEMGYLLGDVIDKFNIMSDISLTQKRLYHEWKPIEHINAYEQIANLGVDVGHIIDMIKGVETRARGQHQRANEDVDLTKTNTYVHVKYYVEKQLKQMSSPVSKDCSPASKNKLSNSKVIKIVTNITRVKKVVTKAKSNVAKALAKTKQGVIKTKLALEKTKQNLGKVKRIKTTTQILRASKIYYEDDPTTPK